jgi:glycosyltransferase involved in cell wall biosynthesis
MSEARNIKNVLVICPHRENRSPGQRFRYEMFIPFLTRYGYRFDISKLLNAKDDRILYSPGNYLGKARIFLKSWVIRIKDWMRMNRYDIIFIFRDALLTGSTFFERRFSGSRAKVVFDFDDAIWMHNISDANRRLSFLKNPAKTSTIISHSDLIFAGNQFLADYALQFNSKVEIVPTTIDTDVYIPDHSKRSGPKICIGWSGSFSTIQHFATAIPVLKKIRDSFGDRVYFKIIGDGTYYCEELDTQGEPWKSETEVEELNKIDIGIMPLPDDEWSKGKCGLKGLQYMALEIPTLMSPIGVNKEIIQEGVNGYLPSAEDEWFECIASLIENRSLRNSIGKAARETVLRKYSRTAWENRYLEKFDRLTHQPTK